MKKVFSLSVLSLFIISCVVQSKLPQEEKAKFSLSGYDVIYEGKPVARYENKEYEYSNGKFQFEYSFVQLPGVSLEMTPKIMYYLSSVYPDAKIEIKLQMDIEK